MELHLIDIVPDTITNASGYTLYLRLKENVKVRESVRLSFKDAMVTSSSFLNSSIGALIEEYGVDVVKQVITPVGMSPFQAQVLRKYITSFEKTKRLR